LAHVDAERGGVRPAGAPLMRDQQPPKKRRSRPTTLTAKAEARRRAAARLRLPAPSEKIINPTPGRMRPPKPCRLGRAVSGEVAHETNRANQVLTNPRRRGAKELLKQRRNFVLPEPCWPAEREDEPLPRSAPRRGAWIAAARFSSGFGDRRPRPRHTHYSSPRWSKRQRIELRSSGAFMVRFFDELL
jgi:hypothetical protein